MQIADPSATQTANELEQLLSQHLNLTGATFLALGGGKAQLTRAVVECLRQHAVITQPLDR